MWIDNKPFENITTDKTLFSFSYQLGIGSGTGSKISFDKNFLKSAWQCDDCDYSFYSGGGVLSQASRATWMFKENTYDLELSLSDNNMNLTVYFFYSYDRIKTIKMKGKDGVSTIFSVNKENKQITKTNNGTTSWNFFSVWTDASNVTNITHSYDDNYFCLQMNLWAIQNNYGNFDRIYEINVEDYSEPYVWTTQDNMSWTPSQLNFSSIVKYSNILTEDNSDSGDATLLPETSSVAGAEHYLKDAKGYCYIEDNEGNIVYNKLLNTIARKTKINNGYRINGSKSLELISFNNNIRNNYDKQPGQYLFDNDKKQKYGDKEDKNKIILEQNIPYFGGNPTIYPVLIKETYSEGTAFSGVLQKRGNKIIYNNKTYNINENDEVILYQRIGGLEMKNEPENEPNFLYEHTNYSGIYSYQIYNMDLKFETTSKTYSLKTNSDFDFDFNQTHNSNIWTEITNLFYKKIISTSQEECVWEFKNSFSSTTTQNASIWWGLVGKNASYFQLKYTGLIDHFVIPNSTLDTPMKFEGFLQQGYLSNPYMKDWKVWGLFSFPYMRGIYNQIPERTNFDWTYQANENQSSRYTAHISPTWNELYEDDWEEYLSSFSKKLSTFTNTVVTDYISLGGDGSWRVNRYYDGKDDLNQFDADEKDLSPIGWKINSGSYFSNYSSSHSEQYNEYLTTKTFHWCFLPNELPAYAIVIWKNGKLLENS